MKNWFKAIFLIGLFLSTLFLLRFLPVMEDLQGWLKSFQDDGARAMWIFGLIGVFLTLCFMPVSPVISSAGFVFGWFWGFVIASGVLLCGLSGGFWIGRWLWPKISGWEVFQQRIFQAVRQAVEKEGDWVICLLRMTPFLHFMTGNLFFGSLRLRFLPYLGFSYLGAVPGTLLMVVAGHLAASSISADPVFQTWQIGFFLLGLVIVAFLTHRMTRITRKILSQENQTSKS